MGLQNRRYLYIASDNTAKEATQAGEALGVDNQDIIVYKVIFGTPSDATYLKIYDKVNPILNSTTSLAAFITQPTAAAGKDWVREVDFGEGLHLGEGGAVVTNASQVTVIWAPLEE